MSIEAGIIVKILTELRVIDGTPFPNHIPGAIPELPSWISSGDGQSLIINRAIGEMIADLSNCLYVKEPLLAKSISAKDWVGIVQSVLGPLLAAVDLDAQIQISSKNILQSLKIDLANTEWNFKKRIFIFGCSVISNHQVLPFLLGPVTIWSRSDWLDHALATHQISRVTHRRLTTRWSGKNLGKRKPSSDSLNEHAIFNAVGIASCICTVETDGLFGEFAKDKALIAARLALLGVGLMWASPSKALKEIGLIYDGVPYRQTYAFHQGGIRFLSGTRWANSLHGVALFDRSWDALIEQGQEVWQMLAEVIEFLLSANGSVNRPKLANGFTHALIWFHEACREPMPMIAVTKFMASLDSLAGGRGMSKYGIIDLVCARIKQDRTATIRPDGPTIESAIKNLYQQGRSRLIHGGSDRIGHDWQDSRDLAENFARLGLIFCFDWAAKNPNCDDLKMMAQL